MSYVCVAYPLDKLEGEQMWTLDSWCAGNDVSLNALCVWILRQRLHSIHVATHA